MKLAIKNKLRTNRLHIVAYCIAIGIGIVVGFRVHDPFLVAKYRTEVGFAAMRNPESFVPKVQAETMVASASAQAKQETMQKVAENPNQFLQFNPASGKVELK